MLQSPIGTPGQFESAIIFGQTVESLTLEFKETISNWHAASGAPNKDDVRRKSQKELCRDIAQFANSLGGCLLIGVAETPGPSGMKVASHVAPIAHIDEMRQWIETAVTLFLTPSTFTREIVVLRLAPGAVLAINVPASRELVALWDRQSHAIEFVHRTSHGKAWMNPDEAERHRMNSSRAGRLAVLEARQQATSESVEITGGFRARPRHGPEQHWSPTGPVMFGQLDDRTFELRVPTGDSVRALRLPFSVVDDAWVDSSGRVSLLLSVRPVMWDQQLVIERI
jgi:hypothetical protein